MQLTTVMQKGSGLRSIMFLLTFVQLLVVIAHLVINYKPNRRIQWDQISDGGITDDRRSTIDKKKSFNDDHLEREAAILRSPREFQNIALIVHCRAKPEICEQRIPIYEGYRRFFHALIWMVADPFAKWATFCHGNGDPYQCVARVLREDVRADEWSGVFYLHFDAILSPCALAQGFDPSQIGVHRAILEKISIERLNWCNWRSTETNRSYEGLEVSTDTGCLWWHWGAHSAVNWLKAIMKVRKEFPTIVHNDTTVWRGFDDLFYVPRQAFSIFLTLGDIFASEDGLPHEAVGPTMMFLSEQLLDVKLQDLHCDGGCCSTIPVGAVARHGFKCGHKVDWRQNGVRDAVEHLQVRECFKYTDVEALQLNIVKHERHHKPVVDTEIEQGSIDQHSITNHSALLLLGSATIDRGVGNVHVCLALSGPLQAIDLYVIADFDWLRVKLGVRETLSANSLKDAATLLCSSACEAARADAIRSSLYNETIWGGDGYKETGGNLSCMSVPLRQTLHAHTWYLLADTNIAFASELQPRDLETFAFLASDARIEAAQLHWYFSVSQPDGSQTSFEHQWDLLVHACSVGVWIFFLMVAICDTKGPQIVIHALIGFAVAKLGGLLTCTLDLLRAADLLRARWALAALPLCSQLFDFWATTLVFKCAIDGPRTRYSWKSLACVCFALPAAFSALMFDRSFGLLLPMRAGLDRWPWENRCILLFFSETLSHRIAVMMLVIARIAPLFAWCARAVSQPRNHTSGEQDRELPNKVGSSHEEVARLELPASESDADFEIKGSNSVGVNKPSLGLLLLSLIIFSPLVYANIPLLIAIYFRKRVGLIVDLSANLLLALSLAVVARLLGRAGCACRFCFLACSCYGALLCVMVLLDLADAIWGHVEWLTTQNSILRALEAH